MEASQLHGRHKSPFTRFLQHQFYYHYTLELPCQRQGACVDKLHVKAATRPTPGWSRQIQERPNQPWTRCSITVPPPASQGPAYTGQLQHSKRQQVLCRSSKLRSLDCTKEAVERLFPQKLLASAALYKLNYSQIHKGQTALRKLHPAKDAADAQYLCALKPYSYKEKPKHRRHLHIVLLWQQEV